MLKILLLTLLSACGACATHPEAAPADGAAPADVHLTTCTTDAGTFEVVCGSPGDGGGVFCTRANVVACDLTDAGPTYCCKRGTP